MRGRTERESHGQGDGEIAVPDRDAHDPSRSAQAAGRPEAERRVALAVGRLQSIALGHAAVAYRCTYGSSHQSVSCQVSRGHAQRLTLSRLEDAVGETNYADGYRLRFEGSGEEKGEGYREYEEDPQFRHPFAPKEKAELLSSAFESAPFRYRGGKRVMASTQVSAYTCPQCVSNCGQGGVHNTVWV